MSTIINLLEETREIMHRCHLTEQAVTFVTFSDSGVAYAWEDFASIAADVNYNNSYGCEEINISLQIVFDDDSWLERNAYDGSEWWEYKKTPSIKAVSAQPLTRDQIYDPL